MGIQAVQVKGHNPFVATDQRILDIGSFELVFNHLLKEKGLAKKYQPTIEGDKIKFIPLKVPNPIRQTVIAFPNTIPTEFCLDKYIDYDAQFETNFVNPLLKIINCIGWKMEKTSSLEDLFA